MKDQQNELVLDRVLDAPRAAIWRCWTEPALREQWFCPKPWHVTDAVLDPRPVGEFSTIMRGPDGEEIPNTGVFLEVVPGERLVFTDAFAPGGIPSGKPFMAAHVSFEDAGDGRTRHVARALHWTMEARQEHEAMGFHPGWNAAADQLEALAKTLQGDASACSWQVVSRPAAERLSGPRAGRAWPLFLAMPRIGIARLEPAAGA